MSAIPWVGQDIVEFIWGGFSVNNATLNRFFALHFVLPFVLAALALMHLIVLHDRAGSGNPLGISGNPDRLPFAPYFIFKDLITIFIFILVLSIFVFYMPNVLGDSENYVMANPMQTPPAIVPEWYLLPFYAILRSIPNKLLGVIAMFSAILMLLVMPFADLSRSRGIQFRPLSKIMFFIFVGNFLALIQLGAKHVESPFIEFGQISTIYYFAHFLIILPFVSLLENSLTELWSESELSLKKNYQIEKNDKGNYNEESEYTAPSYAIMKSFLASFMLLTPKRRSDKGYGNNDSDNDDNGNENSGEYNDYNKKANNDRMKTNGHALDNIIYTKSFYPVMLITTISAFIFFYNVFVNTIGYLSTIISKLLSLMSSPVALCDAPRPWGVYFQDSATPQMEALVELHDNIMFYLVIILFGVGWILISIVNVYNSTGSPISLKYLSHGASIELIWTVTPAIILILIAFPSFKLLYLMDEVSDPAMVILAEGHQWYWSYQYADFMNADEEFIEFDSYLVPESDLENGALRMLEVDNRLIIPELTHVRFIVGGADVIHSFACPALGIKCDAYPGRLNQSSVMINRAATFYGQCSEICGILHSSMPIVIESVSIEGFLKWLLQQ